MLVTSNATGEPSKEVRPGPIREQAPGEESSMLTFCGSDLELVIERVLLRRSSYVACVGRDISSQMVLLVAVDDDPAHLVWMCAPISARALRAVLDGKSTLKDALCHSVTGTAELIMTDHGRVAPDRCVLGSDVPE